VANIQQLFPDTTFKTPDRHPAKNHMLHDLNIQIATVEVPALAKAAFQWPCSIGSTG